MKIKQAEEVEKKIRLSFINDENEEDNYELRICYDNDKKKWTGYLSGEFEEDEVDAIKNIISKLNLDKVKPFVLSFIKEK